MFLKLAGICTQRYAVGDEKCLLFPTLKIAEECRLFIQNRSASLGRQFNARLVHLVICPEDQENKPKIDRSSIGGSCADLHIVLFPKDAYSVAKEFWQHTGLGISSRLAEKCLSLLPDSTQAITPVPNRYPIRGAGRHYSSSSRSSIPSSPANPSKSEVLDPEHATYLEERYGRNLPLSSIDFAKRALRSRVAGVLVSDSSAESQPTQEHTLAIGPSTRGVTEVSADDVYLFPCGMAAVWNAHATALKICRPAKSVCFG